MRPIIHKEPDQQWVDAKNRQVLPEQVYKFYCVANYFSLDKAPKYLDDPDRFLFSFLSSLLRGTRDSFDESHTLLQQLINDSELVYTPTKKIKGEKWDPEASRRTQRSFKYLIFNITSILDQFSEVVSIFFHGDIPSITVGRSSFKDLLSLVRSDFEPKSNIITPKEAWFQKIHKILDEEINVSGDSKQWIELLYLYRDKLDHLGHQMFQTFRLPDSKGNYYSFLPKRWPLFRETDINLNQSNQNTGQGRVSLESYMKENYMHQDILTYSENLLLNVSNLINRCFNVLCAVYVDFQDFQLNSSALKSLKKKKRDCSFKYFE